MATEKIVQIVSDELRQLGIGWVRLSGKGGTWTMPARIEFEVDGKPHVATFWDGSHSDEKTAECVLIDVLAAIWKLPGDQTRARLLHQRSEALR